MNDQQWLTAADAAKVLKVTTRQVHRYAEHGQLVTRRAGRRVLFSAASVAQLADDLAVDIRPSPQRQELLPPEMVRYLQEQAELMRQQGETQSSIDRRLAEIERKLSAPARVPPLVICLLAAIVLLVAVAIVVLVFR
jgi:DNA-binding transcriptional MerR regulator